MVLLALVATLMEKARRRERVVFGADAGAGSTRREGLPFKLNGAGRFRR